MEKTKIPYAPGPTLLAAIHVVVNSEQKKDGEGKKESCGPLASTGKDPLLFHTSPGSRNEEFI
jgi:hypothetical protein